MKVGNSRFRALCKSLSHWQTLESLLRNISSLRPAVQEDEPNRVRRSGRWSGSWNSIPLAMSPDAPQANYFPDTCSRAKGRYIKTKNISR